mmetsp:Transcript_16634/g.15939  ORF Transcript_16634/g.15939 Transcript_16634/m.15939 type:complete len:107 (+) Transcript_16634:382-702(+)
MKIEYVRIIKHQQFKSFYSLIIKLNSIPNAEVFYHAFNGRFFGEEQREIMHTVFLSGLTLITSEEKEGQLENDEWLISLPNCPQCLEKLDTTVSGLHGSIFYETFF